MTSFNNSTVTLGRLIAALVFLCIALSVMPARAATYQPASDAVVLATVPMGTRAAKAGPRDLQSAVAQAAADIEAARASGDPRYLGYAQRTLGPWWNAKNAPLPVVLIRAQIHQHNHSFAAAITDLGHALALDPRNAQARLTRAAIYQVQGNYTAAAADCRSLAMMVEPLITADCMSRVSSHRGEARGAYRKLLALLNRVDEIDPRQRREIELTLADISMRLGNAETARQHYDRALSATDADAYTLLAFADFLLDQREYREVAALFEQHPEYADLLLRAAIAARTANATAAPAHPCARTIRASDGQEPECSEAHGCARAACPANAGHLAQRLREQYAAHQRRGDFTPSRDYARFLLDIEGQASAALDAALINWQSQREPADAIIVVRAAIAAGRPTAAAPVVTFVRQHGLEDVRLAQLLTRGRI